MDRREFISGAAAACLAASAIRRNTAAAPAAILADDEPAGGGVVMTVTGPVNVSLLGTTLMHEHILVDFIGADKVSADRYQPDEVFRVALPHLQSARRRGCRTFVDCTPAYLGRDVRLLRRLSEAAGLKIVTTTGYYAAANEKFVPAHAYKESAEDLALRWIEEFKRGINGTPIKPGIVKIGVDKGSLSEIDRKIVTAAAVTHLQTGLTIASHTGDGAAAMEQLNVLAAKGVKPSAFIWVHAQNEKDLSLHREAAKSNCWVEFDGVRPERAPEHLEMITALAEAGHLDRTLVSMDAGWYHVGEAGGGKFRGYESLFVDLLPGLRKRFGARGVKRLIETNPRAALAVRVRR